jgi:hypothetical protein
MKKHQKIDRILAKIYQAIIKTNSKSYLKILDARVDKIRALMYA